MTAATTDATRTIRLGLLGFGTVGSGVYRMLEDNREAIESKIGGQRLEVRRIGIKDTTKPRALDASLFTTDLASLVADPEIDVVMELMGGIDPAADLVEAALRAGKHVVTANKELMAKHGSRLVQLARDLHLDLHYEAAVGGGIPLVQPLKHQLAGNDVLKMMGILNGTTNYILSKMAFEGADFADVLAEAQAKGYAEADPTNDVDGFDALYKVSILASIAFGKQVPIEDVYREGIRSVSAEDMRYAATFGYRIKLLGIVEATGPDTILARVHPTMIPLSHPLSSVNGVYNALWLHGDFVGDLMFSGRGAGANPTASAVVGDLVDIGRNIWIGGAGSAIPYGTGQRISPIGELVTRYYIRLEVLDKARVLGEIAALFGEFDVSLANMEMHPVSEGVGEIVFLSHPSREDAVQRAIERLRQMPAVRAVRAVIRVDDFSE